MPPSGTNTYSDVSQTAVASAAFFEAAINELAGWGGRPTIAKVMDFGCGRGQLVQALCQRGFDAYGCDISAYWAEDQCAISHRLSTICRSPYVLPFDDNTFDVVISTQVLEHAQNKEECFQEIYRILRHGGYSMHIYPWKWYLPYEPHIYVPLMNYFWPYCPIWWLKLWAILGVHNEFQHNLSWRAIVALNHEYCREGLSYWTTGHYEKLSLNIFGNFDWPVQFYVDNAYGGFARFFKRLPFKALSGKLGRETREAFLIQQKRA